MPMPSLAADRTRALAFDLLIVAGLAGLDVVARIMPHAPNFTPVAASALFAAAVLRRRALAPLAPILGLAIGDWIGGVYDTKIMMVVYAALAWPAFASALSRTLRTPRMIAPVLVASSLLFFVTTNFAVWAFSPLYAPGIAGLSKCYVAALPFLRNMLEGDLLWGAVLFGGCWLVQGMRAASAPAPAAIRT
jgi:hypothetical protein